MFLEKSDVYKSPTDGGPLVIGLDLLRSYCWILTDYTVSTTTRIGNEGSGSAWWFSLLVVRVGECFGNFDLSGVIRVPFLAATTGFVVVSAKFSRLLGVSYLL